MKQAVLTIDDAPVRDLGEKLDVLEAASIRALLFCTGELLERWPDQAVDAIRRGHVLGNHSYDHPHFSDLSLFRVRLQIERTHELLTRAYERAGVPWAARHFRFPYLDNGDRSEYLRTDWSNRHVREIQAMLVEYGYRRFEMPGITYDWWSAAGLDRCINVDATYDTFDWVLEQDEPHEFGYHRLPSLLARLEEHVPEGCRGMNYPGSNEIVMMHAFIPTDAFSALVRRMVEKGIQFVSAPYPAGSGA